MNGNGDRFQTIKCLRRQNQFKGMGMQSAILEIIAQSEKPLEHAKLCMQIINPGKCWANKAFKPVTTY